MHKLLHALAIGLAFSGALSAQVVDTPFIAIESNKGVTDAEFLSNLLDADIILLGERHGREAFQSRERQILEALALGGVYPALVFEMLQPSQMPKLEAHRAEHPEAASGLGAALTWWDTGWCKRRSNICADYQGAIMVQDRFSFIRVLASMTSFRMTAVRATLGFFPKPTRRL